MDEVTLDRDYGAGMVVVATANYSESEPPLVVRVKDAESYQFWVTVQRADDSTAAVSGIDVHYVVMQEGVYGNMEAIRFESTVTDGAGSGSARVELTRIRTPALLWRTGDERHRGRGILSVLGPGIIPLHLPQATRCLSASMWVRIRSRYDLLRRSVISSWRREKELSVGWNTWPG